MPPRSLALSANISSFFGATMPHVSCAVIMTEAKHGHWPPKVRQSFGCVKIRGPQTYLWVSLLASLPTKPQKGARDKNTVTPMPSLQNLQLENLAVPGKRKRGRMCSSALELPYRYGRENARPESDQSKPKKGVPPNSPLKSRFL